MGLARRRDQSLSRLKRRALLPLAILAVPWSQELVDQALFGGQWNLPLVHQGPWWGLLTAPFSHSGFGHLISNSLRFLPLSWLVLLKGSRDDGAGWIGVLLQVPVWLLWPAASHGLSVLLSCGCLLCWRAGGGLGDLQGMTAGDFVAE